MKKLIQLLFLLLPLVGVGQTSVYHPFPESDAVWTCSLSDPCIFDTGYVYYHYPIAILGDTVIQNQSYKRLETHFKVDYSTSSTCLVHLEVPYYWGAYRQDILNKKVYYVPYNETSEQLLYDFTLEVGDTVQGYFAADCDNYIVSSIDSVVVGNSYRKRWIINGYPLFYMIEGVGGANGPAWSLPYCGGPQNPTSNRLICFQEGGTIMYPDTATSCLTVTDIAKEPREASLLIYPNPTTSTIRIQLPENNLNATRTSLYDMTGRLVYQQPFNPNINLGYLDRGTYIVVVETEEGNYRGTIRKQ